MILITKTFVIFPLFSSFDQPQVFLTDPLSSPFPSSLMMMSCRKCCACLKQLLNSYFVDVCA